MSTSSTSSVAQNDRRLELAQLTQDQLIATILRYEFPSSATSTAGSSTSASSSSSASSTSSQPHHQQHAGSKHAHDEEEMSAQPKQSKRAKLEATSTEIAESADSETKEEDAADMKDIEMEDGASQSATTNKQNQSNKKVAKPKQQQKKKTNAFDFSNVHMRHIAFKVMYIGTKYVGFALQPQAAGRSIEGELLRAFETTKLISSREATRFTRCGRTDKGVHACGQVVALQVRSKLTSGIGILPKGWDWRNEQTAREKEAKIRNEQEGDELWDKQGYLQPHTERDSMCPRCALPGIGFSTDASCDTHQSELDYARMLNGVLPDDIRIVSWQPVSQAFSARFSCTARTYRYFFYADKLNLDRMRQEANRLIGSHDFRNFCKVDPSLNTHFTRFITNIEVKACQDVPEDCVQQTSPWPCSSKEWYEDGRNATGGFTGSGSDMDVGDSASSSATHASSSSTAASSPPLHPDTFCELLIHGNAFLYHQVRCLAGILFLVGRGVESDDLIPRLLDIERTPNKPNYDMAPETPLVLYDTFFPALPAIPGFEYQPKPATEPTRMVSFVAQGGAERFAGLVKQEEHKNESTDSSSTSAATSTAAAITVMSSSSSTAPFSTSSSSSTSSSLRCLYPSPGECLRNVELVFSNLHHDWRQLQMDAKVYELFVNQAARNLQAVRNECQKFAPIEPISDSGVDTKKAKKNNDTRAQQSWRRIASSTSPPATATVAAAATSSSSLSHPDIRRHAPILPITSSCRGLGLRALSVIPHSYSSIFNRASEKSYDEKVAQLKGKKLDRHHSVKDLSAKFRKNASYAPNMQKVE